MGHKALSNQTPKIEKDTYANVVLSVVVNVEHLDQLGIGRNMDFLGVLTAIAELLSGVLVDLLVVELSA